MNGTLNPNSIQIVSRLCVSCLACASEVNSPFNDTVDPFSVPERGRFRRSSASTEGHLRVNCGTRRFIFGACHRVIQPNNKHDTPTGAIDGRIHVRADVIWGNIASRFSPVASPSSHSNSHRVTRVPYTRAGQNTPALASNRYGRNGFGIPRIPGRFIGRLFCADTWSTAKWDRLFSVVSVAIHRRGRGRLNEIAACRTRVYGTHIHIRGSRKRIRTNYTKR